MMMTDRIQPTPLPGDVGRAQWFARRALNASRGVEPYVLNVQGHTVRRHADVAGHSATLDRTKKKNSSLEPPLVIRAREGEVKLGDQVDWSGSGRHIENDRDAVNLTRRLQTNHQNVSRFDGSPSTEARKYPGSMYRAGSTNSIMQPSSRSRHDVDHKHIGDGRALESARRIYARNLSAQHEAGFQSDDNIWTSRLSTYPNSTVDRFGRRVANHGVKIELDTLGVDYRIARSSRTRVDSADGLLEETSARRAGGDDDDRLMPLYGTGNQTSNHLSTRMKGNKSYQSLPDCRPNGGSILKKSSGGSSDGGCDPPPPHWADSPYSKHSSTLMVPGRVRKGSHRSSQSRRVLFNNAVDVYRFDSEDSACSSSECERLNQEPAQRRRVAQRSPGGALLGGRPPGGGMGMRSQSLDDVTAPETSSWRRWMPGKKRDSVQKSKVTAGSKQLEGLALESKRTFSVGDLTERGEGHFDINNIKPLTTSVYYNPHSSSSKLSPVERISTPGPAGRSRILPVISNSISDPQPEEARLRKVTGTSASNTGSSVAHDAKTSLHKMISSTQFVPSGDTVDGTSSAVEMRTCTPGPGDVSQHRASTTSNRSSMEAPILSRMHNLTAPSSVVSGTLTRKPPSTSNHLIYSSQPSGSLRISESSYSSSGYNSDTLSWASKSDVYSRENHSRKTHPPLPLHHSSTLPPHHSGAQSKSLQDRSNQSVRSPMQLLAERARNPKMVAAPAGVNFQLVTESASSKKRLVTTVDLADLKLTPKDIRVKSNKSGNVMHVIAAGVDDTGSVDKKFTLPVHVDPYKITAQLDSTRKLVIEAPVVE